MTFQSSEKMRITEKNRSMCKGAEKKLVTWPEMSSDKNVWTYRCRKFVNDVAFFGDTRVEEDYT